MHRAQELEVTEWARPRAAAVQQVDGQWYKGGHQTYQGERIQKMHGLFIDAGGALLIGRAAGCQRVWSAAPGYQVGGWSFSAVSMAVRISSADVALMSCLLKASFLSKREMRANALI